MDEIIQVGQALPGEYIGKRTVKKWRYHHVDYNDNGFADANKYLPRIFDICDLIIDKQKEIFSGWHTGKNWDGYKLKDHHVVTHWRRKEEMID